MLSLPGRAGRALEGCPRSLFCVYRNRSGEVQLFAPGHTASGRIATKILAPTPQTLPPFHTRISCDGIPWPRNLSKTLGRSGDVQRKIMCPRGREGKLRHHKTESFAVSQQGGMGLGLPSSHPYRCYHHHQETVEGRMTQYKLTVPTRVSCFGLECWTAKKCERWLIL